MKRRTLLLLALFTLSLSAQFACAQTGNELAQSYNKATMMIPMRDGVRLYTEIYAPKTAAAALPFMLLRTPYGSENRFANMTNAYIKEMAEEQYIFVLQDIRGRYKSEGQFVMIRPPRDKNEAKAIDESSDTYDTIEWLLKNVPNHNSRVGAMGISYGGWLTVMAMLDPHPALKAVSPQASPADMFMGDDFHHNGAFRLSYGFEYAVLMETSNINESFNFDEYDTYEWYLKLGPLANANAKYLKGKLPTWNDFVAHPNYDAFWKKLAFDPYLTRVTVPTLNVAGWWDQEDFYGPMHIYDLLEKHDANNMNHLVVGPWNHGGWAGGEGDKLGRINFDSATGKYFREHVQARWFAYYLKDKGAKDWPEALTFRTGSNDWQRHAHWPPRNVEQRKLYFHANGKLSFDPPQAEAAQFDSYISDPHKPVPYRQRPIEPTYYSGGSGWYVWQTEDQRFAHNRPDVLSWESDTLTADVTISGKMAAHLFAATSGTDSDWIVKVIDVYPERYAKEDKMSGYQLMIAGDVLRGRFRKSFQKPEPVKPNEVNEYVVPLHGSDHTFRRGHKIMVQVQSSWFPVIDRNPQKFVENIFAAKEEDFQTATQRVYRAKQFASHVAVPVVRE